MKTAIYSPYLDTGAGGEKYMLTIAEAYAKIGKVEILLDTRLQKVGSQKIKDNIDALSRINWTNIAFKNAPFGEKFSVFDKYKFTRQYDYLFYLTDGSLFISGAKNSFLHIQMPLELLKISVVNKLKLRSFKKVIYNSKFTESYMKSKIKISSQVIYPPVETTEFRQLKKKNIIVNVGRFVRVKKQDVLIESFKELVKDQPKNDWELILMGGVAMGDKEYLSELQREAKGLPIKILTDVDMAKLYEVLGEAKIYWHAMGFGTEDPAEQEHFGIAVVEAMAAGCIPIVVNKGGLKEILDDGKYGLLWNTKAELIDETLKVMKSTNYDRQKIVERSKVFEKERFIEEFLDLK